MGDTRTDGDGEGDAIRVFLRVRPPDTTNSSVPCGGSVLDVDKSKKSVTLLAKPDPKVFAFDSVADIDCTQEAVFSSVGKSLIESCVAGYNGTIFAYGQTGSGKTFTMLGPSEESDNFKHELRGIIPRSFEHLFNLISREHDLHGERKQFLCKCSFLEIYQEGVFDLLDPASANLLLRENIKKGVFVDGLMEQVVTTPNEAYQALSIGWLNRRVGSTAMNRESSRSHAVFTLVIESKEEKNGVTNVRQSQLNLVDLAGSERQKDTNTVGIRLKEAGKINKSLSVLGNVIMSLVDIAHGRTRHVPYRDSKLTFLLRDSLGGNARTSIVACVHPDARCFGETLSTLNFAKRAKMIKNKAVVNEDTQGNVAHLQAEIKRLRDMLLQFQTGSIPAPLTSADAGNVPAALQALPSADALEWKRKFMEAMMFTAKAEQEKGVLRQQIAGLEEEGKKKDRMLQSSRMIIKFRENRIAMLEKSQKEGGGEPPVAINNKLQEDIAFMKQQIEQYPQVSRLDADAHKLRAQLEDARIRLANSTACLLDNSHLVKLEQIYQQLQAAARRESAVTSPKGTPKEKHAAVSEQKLKEKLETLEMENQKLKKQLTEEHQAFETKEAGLQAELTAAKNLSKDLERVLEANNLKHRIEKDALSSMHAHTLKIMTTPTRNAYDLRNRTVLVKDSLDTTMETETETGDIMNEAPPDLMLESANEALTEELKKLQMSNNELQQRIDEYEGDMLRLQQQVGELDLKNASLTEMLAKARDANTEHQADMEKSLHSLQDQVERLTSELQYKTEECRDLQILLTSSDAQLKEEREKTKSYGSESQNKINFLETKILQVESVLETVSAELEKEAKEKEEVTELLETQRMEVQFLEQRCSELEAALQQETSKHQTTAVKLQEAERHLEEEKDSKALQMGKQKESLAEVCRLRQSLEESTKERHEIQSQLEAVTAELAISRSTVTELKRDVADRQEAMQQQVVRIQELKNNLMTTQDERDMHKEESETRAAELSEAQDRCENLQKQVSTKDEEISKLCVELEMLREDLNYYQEQNEKMVQEYEQHDSTQQQLETVQKEKDLLIEEARKLKEELSEREGRLQLITKHLEEAQAQNQQSQPSTPERNAEAAQIAREQKLCSMVEEFNKENQQLKAELSALRQENAEKASLSEKCQELENQLANHEAVYKESIKQLQEVAEAEREEAQILQASLEEAQRQQESRAQEKAILLTQLQEAGRDRLAAESERDRLKSLIEKLHAREDELASNAEVLKEENKRLQEELAESEQHCKKLAEDNALLAGHGNHLQKVNYVKRLQLDYNELKEKYDEVAKENFLLKSQPRPQHHSPLRDRTNLKTMAPDSVEKKAQHVSLLAAEMNSENVQSENVV